MDKALMKSVWFWIVALSVLFFFITSHNTIDIQAAKPTVVSVNDATTDCRQLCDTGSGKPSGNYFGFDSLGQCITNCLAAKGFGEMSVTCDPNSIDGCCNPFASQCQDPDCSTAEVCDGLDNDCDGTVDAIVASCYTGPAGTSGVGVCMSGTATCSSGAWGTCTSEVTPTAETCNAKDDDCDSIVDDDLGTVTCGIGACERTYEACVVGEPQICVPGAPESEQCDAKDNDCDGSVDESLTQSCYTGPAGTAGVGECNSGTSTCTSGTWGTCTGEVLPSTPKCEEKDYNCNGILDNLELSCECLTGETRHCGVSKIGECRFGLERCTDDGHWSGVCEGAIDPQPETCDGLDNDCDGTADEELICLHGQ